MARLLGRDWEAARRLWEADPDMSATEIGRRFGVSKTAVLRQIHTRGWNKAQYATAERAPAAWPRSRYQMEFSDLLIRFFTRDVDEIKHALDHMRRFGRITVNAICPSIQGFASGIGTTMAQLRTWATAVNEAGDPLHPDFRDACRRARDLQLELINRCVSIGLYDERFAALMIANPGVLMGWDENGFPTDSDGFNLLARDGEFDGRCVEPRQPDGSEWPRTH